MHRRLLKSVKQKAYTPGFKTDLFSVTWLNDFSETLSFEPKLKFFAEISSFSNLFPLVLRVV